MHDVSRRNFFKLAGGIAGAGIVLSACKRTPPDTIYVGSADSALLNYLFMLESVLAAFYARSYSDGPQYYGLTKSELELLQDLRDHSLAHKQFLKKLAGTAAIPEIVTNLSTITFADRNNTLQNAIKMEDMAVGAYNGAAIRFKNSDFTFAAAKMATVQARHAAYLRDILTVNSFSDSTVVNANGLDQVLAPAAVMAVLKPYIQTKLDLTKLPA